MKYRLRLVITEPPLKVNNENSKTSASIFSFFIVNNCNINL